MIPFTTHGNFWMPWNRKEIMREYSAKTYEKQSIQPAIWRRNNRRENYLALLTSIFATRFLPATNWMRVSMVSTGQHPSSIIGLSVVSGGLMSARKQRVDWTGKSSNSEGKPRNLETVESWLIHLSGFQLSVESNPELLWFCFTALCDWFKKNSRHLINQSDAKPEPFATWSHAFSRAWRRLRVCASSSHWFVSLFTFIVIVHCNCFGFGFTTLNWKPL